MSIDVPNVDRLVFTLQFDVSGNTIHADLTVSDNFHVGFPRNEYFNADTLLIELKSSGGKRTSIRIIHHLQRDHRIFVFLSYRSGVTTPSGDLGNNVFDLRLVPSTNTY